MFGSEVANPGRAYYIGMEVNLPSSVSDLQKGTVVGINGWSGQGRPQQCPWDFIIRSGHESFRCTKEELDHWHNFTEQKETSRGP